MTEEFPWDTAPRYLPRDRDTSYGPQRRKRIEAMSISEVVTAARSCRRSACLGRLIGSTRKNCLDHVIVRNEHHL